MNKVLRLLCLLIATPLLLAQPQQAPVVNDDRQHHGEVIAGVDQASEILNAEIARTNAAARPVLTRSYDNLRSGANTAETQLTPTTVRGGLRVLAQMSIGGDARGLDAQVLLVPNVNAIDGVYHDLLFASTMGNILAAFDANDGTPVWMRRLGNPITGSKAIDIWQINPHFGIMSTGVIRDNIWYVVAWMSSDGQPANGYHRLFAIKLSDGTNAKPPLALPASPPLQRKQRASLTVFEAGGQTLIAIPSGTIQETAVGAHGFITLVDLNSWTVVTDYNMTPTGKGGGVWQAGQGLIVDAESNLYAMVSNGDYDGKVNFGESFVKMRYADKKLAVIDHFSPYRDNDRAPGFEDMDLGSGAPSLIPELGLLFGAGKDGVLWTMPWRKLAASPIEPIWYTFFPGPGVPAKPTDKLLFDRTHHAHGSSVIWKTGGEWRSYVWGENGNLRAWRVTAKGLEYLANGQEVSSAQSRVPPGGMPGGFLTLSANGATNGVIWATVPMGDANRMITQGYLAAYDATTFDKYADGSGAIRLLWRSDPFVFSKFNPPVVSGGKVYVPTYDGKILIFGL